MLTIDLTDAQATGLLALLEHAELRATENLRLDPRQLAAMQRGVERFRRAIEGATSIPDFDPILEDLGRTLDGLHDPRVITRCLARVRDLIGSVRIAAGVERFRRHSARRGDEAYCRWADGVLHRFGTGDPRWIDAAVTLFDDVCAGPEAPAGRRPGPEQTREKAPAPEPEAPVRPRRRSPGEPDSARWHPEDAASHARASSSHTDPHDTRVGDRVVT